MIMCQYMFRCDESMTLNPNYCVFQDLMQVEGGLISKKWKTALNYLCSGLNSYYCNTYEECDKKQQNAIVIHLLENVTDIEVQKSLKNDEFVESCGYFAGLFLKSRRFLNEEFWEVTVSIFVFEI